jgi:prevent-host-death family protein
MEHVINVKELRASLPEIVKRVRQGDQYTVLYRSHPAFRIVGVGAEEELTIPLSGDPLYGAPAVGKSSDGLAAQDHDRILYGKDV